MSDKMNLMAFSELLERVFSEERNQKSIFSIKEDQFCVPKDRGDKVFSSPVSSVLGPAAGPHTQLAQNIISAYIAGARFLELKTVQKLDELEIEKPCIDAENECYNVEWSTELKLSDSFDEYLKAYFVVSFLDILLGNKKPSFLFNASIGYDLGGIKTKGMDEYIEKMKNAALSPLFEEYKEVLAGAVRDGILEGTCFESAGSDERALLDAINTLDPRIASSFTVSTMHGCPPDEIEAICEYLLEEKSVDVFVKLNPTLLGYDEVRRILDTLGYTHIALSRSAFDKDLQYGDAVSMLSRLMKKASSVGRNFGIKLTNTLSTVNDKSVLPGGEMYMSGRPLFPIAITLAERISKEFDGNLPISFSGGVDEANVTLCYKAGLSPITLATDLLKPGGYTRFGALSKALEKVDGKRDGKIDIKALEECVRFAIDPEGHQRKDYKDGVAKVPSSLPLFDCYVAPCVEHCPIHQMIPDYIALAGEGRLAEALAVIYLDNALPNITGYICDHMCQNHCTRNDYEGPVKIRNVKKIVARDGYEGYMKDIFEKSDNSDSAYKAAVIGGGPAGLATSYFLTRAGFSVELFEKDEKPGGVVASTIPSFRIPDEVVDRDVAFVKENGVVIHTSSTVTVKELREKGFSYIFIAIGAEKSKDPRVDGNGRMMSAISFLRARKEGKLDDKWRHVVVSGGGNTAMDASREALRMDGVEDVTVVYRRTESEMPADKEEYLLAKNEGVKFMFLSSPREFDDGILTLSMMELGEKDDSGRARPVPTGKIGKIPADVLVNAIGEVADQDQLEMLGYDEGDEKIFLVGDVASGPATVVKAIASARKAVENAIDMVYEEMLSSEDDEDAEDEECSCGHHHHHHDEECSCGSEEDEDDVDESDEKELRDAENEYFKRIRSRRSSMIPSLDERDRKFLSREAKRCLECSYYCNKCVDVCPNRANVMIDMRSWEVFKDPFQIVHIDAYCNECGNCSTFCPHEGRPYRDKFTIFSTREGFEHSSNDGFIWQGGELSVRCNGEIHQGAIDQDGFVTVDGVDAEVEMLIDEIFTSYSYLLGDVKE